ncbi:hypothetical protein K4K57_011464 [Colletotrichum sp. SAR 10_99]|nr:hypothetical protein K4K57_011464 [Colletotrichum sp. SAR 10_99]
MTVDFNGLYDNGNATYKHRIIKAVTAAGSHLKGYAHNGSSAALPAVIEAFGVRVTGCDQDKAELNNETFKRALDEGYQVLRSAKRHSAPENMPNADNGDTIEEIVVAYPHRSSSLAGVHYTSFGSSHSSALLNDAADPHLEVNGVTDASENDTFGHKALRDDDARNAFTAATDGTNPSVIISGEHHFRPDTLRRDGPYSG